MKEMLNTSTLSVKEYAKLINKSDKTVYKMIKEGLVNAKKEKNEYAVLIDAYLIARYQDINKSLSEIKVMMALLTKEISSLQSASAYFEKRVKALEANSLKKTVVKKRLIKPVNKLVKKPILRKSTKKIAKKLLKRTKSLRTRP